MTPERLERMRTTLQRRQTTLTVLMENVHKPHNYAAILRSCEAVGIQQVHTITTELIASAQDHASASAAKWVDVHIHSTISEGVHHLQGTGFTVLAAHPGDHAVDFRSVDYTKPTAILMGAELEGATAEALELVDQHIVIPMGGMIASLNVSVAAAIVLFEAQRQRQRAGMYDRPHLDPEVITRKLFEWAHPRVAQHCRMRQVPYPTMNDQGDIIGEFPR